MMNEKNRSLYEKGLKTRRQVLGDVHVDQSLARAAAFEQDFQTFITETAWGNLWSRPHFSKRERSIVTLALLAAAGHDAEFALHVRSIRNTGASVEDIFEALMHVAIYAGIPAANHAMKIVKEQLEMMHDQEYVLQKEKQK